jgi:flagellar basal-body rod protein FlgB
MDILRRDLTSNVLAKALDGLALRAQTITNNVANLDTPNFKASEVSFEDDLRAALGRSGDGDLQLLRTDPGHLGTGRPRSVGDVTPAVTRLVATTLRNDGNNVDVDREMARLAETQLSFQAATQLLNVKFRQLREAIWEGKR